MTAERLLSLYRLSVQTLLKATLREQPKSGINMSCNILANRCFDTPFTFLHCV